MGDKQDKNGNLHTYKHVNDADYLCGIGVFRIPYLQKFASAAGFTGFYILPILVSQSLASYITSQIPALEKQFGLSSYESGVIMTFNDIGFLAVGFLVSSIPNLVHVPRWLFAANIVFALSGLLCSLPHFVIQSKENSLKLAIKTDNTINKTISNTINYPLCQEHAQLDVNESISLEKEKSTFFNVGVDASLKTLSIGLIAIGMSLQGAAKSFRTPFLTQYIDGEDKKKTGFYMGILTGSAIFGPAIAYGLGGFFSNIYVTLEDIDMSTKDPRWIGAWWLGFLVFGVFSLIVVFPVVCFPRRLAEKVKRKEEPEINLMIKEELQISDEKHDCATMSTFAIIKERAASYIRVMKSLVYTCMVFAGVLHMSSIVGPVAFKTKYVADQFGVPLWKANVLISGLTMATVSIGAFLGGVITRKIKMSPRMIVGFIIILHIGQVVFHGGLIFVGCEQPEIIGPETKTNLSDSCHCEPSEFLPVCGTNGLNYHSPCYAGCTEAIRNGRIYRNCTMIPEGETSAGLCPFDCNTLIPYLVLTLLGSACGSLKIMPLFIATIRSVEDRDKSTAAGLQSIIVSLLAFIPAPIIFGKVIDTTCIIWDSSSKRKGACSLYNIESLRYGIFGTVLVYKAAAIILFSIALCKVWKIKDWSELRQNNQMKREFNGEPHKN